MGQKSIVEIIEEKLDHGGIDLPVFHPVALKIRHMISRDDYSAADIARVILKDQALASHVLKMANSAFYTGLKSITTIHDAIVRLGAKSISNLVLVVTQAQMYRTAKKGLVAHMTPLWSHAVGTAVAGRWLALRLGLNKMAEEGFLAGLLHDIGKLFLLRVIEELSESGMVDEGISGSLVNDVLDTMHTTQGERLMRHQNMPEIYCQVVARHHDAEVSGDNVIINLARLANLACRKIGIGPKQDAELMLSTTPEAINIMATDLLLAELQVTLEEKKKSMEKLLWG